MSSPSPSPSGPRSSASRPSAKKTYSRRAAAHAQKRKAQAEGARDEEDVNDPGLTESSPSQAKRVKQGHNGYQETSSSVETLSRPDRSSSPLSSLSSASSSRPDAPQIVVEPASSSSGLHRGTSGSGSISSSVEAAPSTPPRRGRATTPGSGSPRDLSALFAAVSPKSVSGSGGSQGSQQSAGSGGGTDGRGKALGVGLGQRRPRKMLSKAQSMSTIEGSPLKRLATRDEEEESVEAVFVSGPGKSAPSTPSKNLRHTLSMPVTPSSQSSRDESTTPRKAGLLIEPGGSPATSGAGGGSGGRATRTYGARRSFLQRGEEKGGGDGLEVEEVRESYAELRKKYEVDAGMGAGGGSGNLIEDLLSARAPEPVSDMRSRGENRLFMDEIAYLIDGLADPAATPALKRATAMDILGKMQGGGEWVGKMVVCGYEEGVWKVLVRAGEGDELGNAICLIYLATLSNYTAQPSLDSIWRAHGIDCARFLGTQLAVRTGPLDRGFKGKVTATVTKLRAMAAKAYPSHIASTSTASLSTLIIASACRDGHTSLLSLPSMVAENIGVKLASTLAVAIKPVVDHLDLYEKGLDLLPTDTELDLEQIENALQAICGLLKASEQVEAMRDKILLAPVFANLVVVTSAISLGGTGDDQIAARCLVLALQLLITVAGSSSWAEPIMTTSGLVTTLVRVILYRDTIATLLSSKRSRSEDSDDETQLDDDMDALGDTSPRYTADDVLCIVIALLASLVFAQKDKSDKLMSIKVAKCTKPMCLRSCRCPGAKSVPEVLVSLYNQFQNGREAISDYLCGYLGLLLSIFITHSRSAATVVVPHLAGVTTRARLEGLQAAISELQGVNTILYRKLKTMGAAGGDKVRSGRRDGEEEENGDRVEGGIDDVLCTSMEELKEYIQGCE